MSPLREKGGGSITPIGGSHQGGGEGGGGSHDDFPVLRFQSLEV